MKKFLITGLLFFVFAASKAQTAEKPDTVSLGSKQKVDSLNTNPNDGFTAVEQSPMFPGGFEEFYKYLAMNIRYPADSRSKRIQGKVILSFVVDKDGSLTDIKVLQSVAADIDKEAIRLITKSPKWHPAMQNGKPVRVLFKAPISFKIN